MKIIKAGTEMYVPQIGDIIIGDQSWLAEHEKNSINHFNIVPLYWVDNNNWKALKKIGVENTIQIKELFDYYCPITEKKFTGIYPLFILTPELSRYEDKIYSCIYSTHMLRDQEWVHGLWFDNKAVFVEHIKLTDIEQCMLGPGYTNDTLPCDGHGRIVIVDLLLDNSDRIVCRCHEWYNK